jgi:hypothetical protein
MPSFALGKELSGLKGLLGRAGYGAGVFTAPSWMPGLFNQGQSSSATSAAIKRAAQIVPGLSPNPRTDLGRQLGNELQYIGGQLMQGRNPYAKPAVGNIPPSANGESYRRAELRLADAARPGGGGGGGGNAGYSVTGFRPIGGTPEERAQAAETSRIAQLTAQDPELQRYETARLKAVALGATPETVQATEDVGMQIWRQKYGTTPMGQTGGAVGSFNPLMQRTFGYQSGMAPEQLVELQKTAAPIPVAPGALPYQMGDLGTRISETGYDPAAYGLTPDKIEEMKKKLLQQASK